MDSFRSPGDPALITPIHFTRINWLSLCPVNFMMQASIKKKRHVPWSVLYRSFVQKQIVIKWSRQLGYGLFLCIYPQLNTFLKPWLPVSAVYTVALKAASASSHRYITLVPVSVAVYLLGIIRMPCFSDAETQQVMASVSVTHSVPFLLYLQEVIACWVCVFNGLGAEHLHRLVGSWPESHEAVSQFDNK